MKYAVILPDGAADEPVAALGGRTPLEAARTPNMDWVAANGRVGTVVTVPDGFSPGSDVATLSLFGYDPRVDYTGRAPLEAAAQGLAAGPDDLIFRCNFITILDGKMHDFTAGHISQPEADQLIAALNRAFVRGLPTADPPLLSKEGGFAGRGGPDRHAERSEASPERPGRGLVDGPPGALPSQSRPSGAGDVGAVSRGSEPNASEILRGVYPAIGGAQNDHGPQAGDRPPPGPLLGKEGGFTRHGGVRAVARLRFHGGVSYRNLLFAGGLPQGELHCVPPHDIPDQPIERHLPRGAGADVVCEIMNRARPVLAAHPVNADRVRRGEKPVTDIWLWGQGRPKRLQPFVERFGMRAAAIAAVDLIRGIAKTAGVEVLHVPGATGYLDTDYANKGAVACAALHDYDLVFVHIEAPDEAGHQGDVAAKVKAIEEIDRHVVGPLLDKLRVFDDWRILIAPDHPTPVEKRVHTRTPPPFCMAGSDIEAAPHARSRRFGESHASSSVVRVDPGHELLAQLIACGTS